MDHVKALEMVNTELARIGRPPLVMGELQARAAYQSLVEYAHVTQLSLEVAVADVVRFQIQGEELKA